MGNAPSTKIDSWVRIAALRAEILRQNLDGFLVPRSDEHLGEYVHPSAERLAWISNFTGSAGLAAVLADKAFIWSDGRYVLQLAQQTDAKLWQRLHLTEDLPGKFLSTQAVGKKIGYDPWLHSEDQIVKLAESGVTLVPVTENLIDRIWRDRPAASLAPAHPHDIAYAGETADEKLSRIAGILRDRKNDAAVLTDPAALAWLLNLRGEDVECTPFALGFVIMRADGRADLFMAPEKLDSATRSFLGSQVTIYPRQDLPKILKEFSAKRVQIDFASAPAWFAQTLRHAGAILVNAADPTAEPRARKNPVEQEGARKAHFWDALAMCQFLHWFANNAVGKTEIDAGEKLQECRRQNPHFKGDSFPAITGAGPHGAIIHYRATPNTNRVIKTNEVFLLDSGGQYFAGTTDITRTLWTGPAAPPAEIRDRFTRVLKGHIALAALIFPDHTPGVRLDAFARSALWRIGLDYDHGTGHGVGSYLSVHEGPASISPYLRPASLRPGMIMSDEPGFYLPGQYGIRLENLVLIKESEIAGTKPFLCFEPLTLVPFERALIDKTLLLAEEIAWLDSYHARVQKTLSPHLPSNTAAWLASATAPLE
jgi:Xaa-Pro aminopeptidase